MSFRGKEISKKTTEKEVVEEKKRGGHVQKGVCRNRLDGSRVKGGGRGAKKSPS